MAALASIYAVTGQQADALRLLNELKAQSLKSLRVALLSCLDLCGLGDRIEDFNWLDERYGARSNHAIVLNVTPQFNSLRPDPR